MFDLTTESAMNFASASDSAWTTENLYPKAPVSASETMLTPASETEMPSESGSSSASEKGSEFR